MASPYTSNHYGIAYDIVCDVNYDLSDLLGVYVNSFEACIEACSSYRAHTVGSNFTCGASSYTPDLDPVHYDGNCYLKYGEAKLKRVSRLGASSAKVQLENL